MYVKKTNKIEEQHYNTNSISTIGLYSVLIEKFEPWDSGLELMFMVHLRLFALNCWASCSVGVKH